MVMARTHSLLAHQNWTRVENQDRTNLEPSDLSKARHGGGGEWWESGFAVFFDPRKIALNRMG